MSRLHDRPPSPSASFGVAAAAPGELGGVRLRLDPAKLLRLTWPIYALIALGVLVNPSAWLPPDATLISTLLLPLLLPLLGWLVRDRWALELTSDALIHQTLRGPERFAWTRMGAVQVRWVHILHLPFARTLWFPFPTDAPHGVSEQITKRMGRRLLAVFGDRSAAETAELLESWRRLALAREGYGA